MNEKDTLRRIQPLLVAKIEASGGFLPKSTLAKIYGDLALEQAKLDGVVQECSAIQRTPNGSHPIKVLHTFKTLPPMVLMLPEIQN